MTSIGFAISLGVLFYSVTINQPISSTQSWAWQKMNIAPFDPPASHTSVATFSFPKTTSPTALTVVTTDTPGVVVNIISLILGDDSLFMSFNWTGGNWTLRFGIQVN